MISHFSVFLGALAPVIYTVAAMVVAMSVVLAVVSPFYEYVRYERRWWDKND